MKKCPYLFFTRLALLLLSCSVFSFCQTEWKQSVTKDFLPYQTSLEGIVFGLDRFFIGGYNINTISSEGPWHSTYGPAPLVLTSSNVQSWVVLRPASSAGVNLPIYNVFYAGNRLFAYQQPEFFSSIDGRSWDYARFAGHVSSLSYIDSIYVAVGHSGIQTSVNGMTWVLQDTSRRYVSITAGSDKLVVVDDSGKVRVSDNGKSWTEAKAVLNVVPWRIVFGNDQFIIIGDSGTVAVSKDAQNWTTTRLSPELWGWRDIVYGDDKFLAVGCNGLSLSSSNAETWIKTVVDSSIQFTSIAYGNTTFVAVASNNSVWYLREKNSAIQNKIYTSKHGKPQVKIVTSKTNISIDVLDNMSLHSPAKIALFTCTGRRVREYFSTPLNNTFTIPVNGVPAGKYYISFNHGNGEKSAFSLVSF
jgi:hypothetical protein